RDLEGGAEEEPETDEAIEIAVSAGTDQRADPARVDGRVPARLLQHHLEVVRFGEIERVVAPPAELDGLALDTLARHALGFLEDGEGEARPQRGAVVDQRPQTDDRDRVAALD